MPLLCFYKGQYFYLLLEWCNCISIHFSECFELQAWSSNKYSTLGSCDTDFWCVSIDTPIRYFGGTLYWIKLTIFYFCGLKKQRLGGHTYQIPYLGPGCDAERSAHLPCAVPFVGSHLASALRPPRLALQQRGKVTFTGVRSTKSTHVNDLREYDWRAANYSCRFRAKSFITHSGINWFKPFPYHNASQSSRSRKRRERSALQNGFWSSPPFTLLAQVLKHDNWHGVTVATQTQLPPSVPNGNTSQEWLRCSKGSGCFGLSWRLWNPFAFESMKRPPKQIATQPNAPPISL